ncbi:MAG: RNA methyltransferase [Butyrivibrio sp.]|nr:RNA methyltransferase [Butyrivibrio sp.]
MEPNIIEIDNLNSPELAIYANRNESQLLHINEPELGIFIAESPNVIIRAMDAGYEPISFLLEKKTVDKEASSLIDRWKNVPVYVAEMNVLEQITGFKLTRGVLCAMKRKEYPSIESICQNARRIAILEDVVNPTNVGAIFRSAAALNMDAVLLSPACSDPLYRRAARVSMGTVFQVPWTYFPKSEGSWNGTGMDKLHGMGFKMAAMALDEKAIPISDERLHSEDKLAIVLGTEGEGLADETISKCDYTVIIPMTHGVDSLNVAAASAVAFWELGKN